MVNSTVKNWRDDVSTTLGRLDERTKNMDTKLNAVCKIQSKHDDRIDVLEIAHANRSAVQKKMHIVYGMIITVITAGANIAFKVFK